MLDLLDLARCRQQMIEVAFPAGRVLTAAVLAHSRPVQHAFDSSPHSRSRLILGLPDGLQDFEDLLLPHITHMQLTHDGICIRLQGGFPLGSVLGVLPGVSVGFDVGCGSLLEGLLAHLLDTELANGRLALGDGIDTPADIVTRLPSFLLGVSQRNVWKTAQTHVPAFVAGHEAQHPRARAGFVDVEVQSCHATHRVVARLLQTPHLQR